MEDSRKPGWIEEVSRDDRPDRKELAKLYEVFQTRQIADLDMLHRYANYYVAVLLAMLTAFALGLTRGHSVPVPGFLVVLPVVSFMLSQQGKLMAFRFYRRYNEGRMRLTKIEYLLGLHGRIEVSKPFQPPYALWREDQAFVLGRYIHDVKRESSSREFVKRRSRVPRSWEPRGTDEGRPFTVRDAVKGTCFRLRRVVTNAAGTKSSQKPHEGGTCDHEAGYGVGYIVQTTFTVFSALFVGAIILPAIGLLLSEATLLVKVTNFFYTGIGLAFVCGYMHWYSQTLARMERETPDIETSSRACETSKSNGL